MGFNCRWTYGQSSSDLRIIQSFNHQGENFTFAPRQVEAGRLWQVSEAMCGRAQAG